MPPQLCMLTFFLKQCCRKQETSIIRIIRLDKKKSILEVDVIDNHSASKSGRLVIDGILFIFWFLVYTVHLLLFPYAPYYYYFFYNKKRTSLETIQYNNKCPSGKQWDLFFESNGKWVRHARARCPNPHLLLHDMYLKYTVIHFG